MTDQDRLREKLFRPDRRQIISGMAALAAATTIGARGAHAQQKRIVISEGDFAPLPIAIPNFAAGTPGDAEVGAGVTQVITNTLKRSGLFAPIDQAAYIEKAINIDAARISRTGRPSTRRHW
jgi:TolB protein